VATIAPVIASVGSTSLQGWQVVWGPMQNGDVGAPISSPLNATKSFGGNIQDMAGFSDRSLVVTGTFGAGGTLTWEGSNDGVNYVTLTDPQGNPLNLALAEAKAVTEAVIFARPHVTGGDGTTSLTVAAFCRRTFQQPGFEA
jgi:hypothetical protein